MGHYILNFLKIQSDRTFISREGTKPEELNDDKLR